MIEKQLLTGDRSKLVKPATYIGLIIIVSLIPLFIRSPYYLHTFILIFIYIIATSSLRMISISGQFPLAQGAFMGIGAFASAVSARSLGWPVWLTIPFGVFMATVIGVFIAYPFSRLRAIYYAMVSLFFGIGIIEVLFVFQKWTNALSGLTGIPPLFGTSKIPYYYFFVGLTSLSLLALYRFESCRIGTTLKAIAQSYLVASSVGINEARYRVLAVGVGCFFAGLAGATYAHFNLVLSYTSFDMNATLWLFVYALIGGIGSFAGPIIGTIVLMLIPELIRGLKEFVPYLSAAILFVVVFGMPQGLVGLPQLVKSWVAKRSGRKVVSHAS